MKKILIVFLFHTLTLLSVSGQTTLKKYQKDQPLKCDIKNIVPFLKCNENVLFWYNTFNGEPVEVKEVLYAQTFKNKGFVIANLTSNLLTNGIVSAYDLRDSTFKSYFGYNRSNFTLKQYVPYRLYMLEYKYSEQGEATRKLAVLYLDHNEVLHLVFDDLLDLDEQEGERYFSRYFIQGNYSNPIMIIRRFSHEGNKRFRYKLVENKFILIK